MLGALWLTIPASVVLVVEPPRQTMLVRLYDLSDARPSLLSAAVTSAGQILAAAGVSTRWEFGAVDNDEARAIDQTAAVNTRQLDRRNYLAVRLVRGFPKAAAMGALGFALPQAAFGVHVTVYVDRVESLDSLTPDQRATILGAAIAHEIGHVLLASNEHSPSGIMKARWSSRDLRHAATGGLRFTASQGARMQDGAHARQFLHQPHSDP
jgi:hypothetical protein